MSTTNYENLDLDAANQQLESLDAVERIEWAHETFDDGLFSISSFGVASALMLRLIQQTGIDIPVITIDTGFWFPETHSFRQELTEQFDLDLHIYGPTPDEIEKIAGDRLWETDLDTYHAVTKLAPLKQAIGELGVTALLSGVRRQQTSNRATLKYIDVGNDGELRIHPVLDWSDEQESEFFERENLPRNPLYYQNYGSVGDLTTTTVGEGRNGRSGLHTECGIHLKPRVGVYGLSGFLE
jgi:phosphoadenosine phosphosulfate reductase